MDIIVICAVCHWREVLLIFLRSWLGEAEKKKINCLYNMNKYHDMQLFFVQIQHSYG